MRDKRRTMMDNFRMERDRTACNRAISTRDARFVSRALTLIVSGGLDDAGSAVGLVGGNR